VLAAGDESSQYSAPISVRDTLTVHPLSSVLGREMVGSWILSAKRRRAAGVFRSKTVSNASVLKSDTKHTSMDNLQPSSCPRVRRRDHHELLNQPCERISIRTSAEHQSKMEQTIPHVRRVQGLKSSTAKSVRSEKEHTVWRRRRA
jgi:hypothetical protein